uniref:Helitron helicase-like domain-containing protein n=1 Tax=Zea mays TaxID=4577 RepID=A0A804UFR8_MAIZE
MMVLHHSQNISNTIIIADENGSKSLEPNVDAKERKRQRERERYDGMSIEQKNEKSRKRREVSQQNKGPPIQPEASRDINMKTCETVNFQISGDVHLGSVSLSDGCSTIDFTNFATQERQRHRERRAKMSVDQRNELNKKRHEARQQNKGQHMMSTVPGDGDEKVNVNQDDDSDWLHRNETFKADDVFTTRDLLTPVDDDDSVIFEDDADENEGYIFAGQYEDTNEDIEIDGSQDESTTTDVPDPYDKVYSNIPEETHMLKTVPNCGYSTANKFEYEPPGFCCRGGKVELAPLETLPNSRGYGIVQTLIMTTNVWDSGIYTFQAQGMIYHNIKSFGREGGAEHKHLELCFYDDDPTLEHRNCKCREEHQQKDKQVIRQIVDILHGNSYSEHLRTMGHVENLDDYRIALNLDQTLNQKTYNTPLTSEVAAVWIEGSEGRGQFSKSVMLHGKDSSSHCIRSYHGCYDALSYPFFFPRGELGWHANIPKVGVSMDEVDAYRATHRASNANDEDVG